MSKTLTVLQEIRRRPGLYLREKSLDLLAAFLRGYFLACDQNEIKDDYFDNFQQWISSRFGCQQSQTWEKIISFHTANADEAWRTMWELIDEYTVWLNRKGGG